MSPPVEPKRARTRDWCGERAQGYHAIAARRQIDPRARGASYDPGADVRVEVPGLPGSSDQRMWRDGWLWGAILAGAILRFARLGGASLWLDEAISARMASLPPAEVIAGVAKDLHPPGYYLLLRFWSLPWPVNDAGLPAEWTIRSLSAVASILTLPLAYWIGSAWDDRPSRRSLVARWAVWIAAASPFAISLARQARPYALLSLVLAAQLALWTRLRKRGGGWPSWTAMAILLILGNYIHYHAALFALALTIGTLASRQAAPGLFPRWGSALLVAGLFTLPMLPRIAAQAGDGVRSWVGFSHSPFVILRTVAAFFRGHDPGSVELSLWTIPVAVLVFRGARRGGGILAACLIVPLAVAYFASLKVNIFRAVYFGGSGLVAWVLAARGIASGTPDGARIGRAAAGLVAIAMIVGVVGGTMPRTERDEPWRELVAEMEASLPPGTPVLFSFETTLAPFDYYAATGHLRGTGALGRDGRGEVIVAPGLGGVVAGSDRIWVVPYQERLYDPHEALRSWLARNRFDAWREIRVGALRAIEHHRVRSAGGPGIPAQAAGRR